MSNLSTRLGRLEHAHAHALGRLAAPGQRTLDDLYAAAPDDAARAAFIALVRAVNTAQRDALACGASEYVDTPEARRLQEMRGGHSYGHNGG